MAQLTPWATYRSSNSAGGRSPRDSCRRSLLNQAMYSTTASSSSVRDRQPPPSNVGSRDQRPPFSEPRSVAAIQHIQSQQLTNFGIFRTPPEGLPGPVRQILRQPTYGASWALAQRLPIENARPMWIVPGNHVICMVERQTRQAVGVGCFTTKDALDHGVVAITLVPPPKPQRASNASSPESLLTQPAR